MRPHTIIEGIIAATATAATSAFGGWDVSIKLLITLILIDYVTGFLAALKHKKLNSDVMYWGGIRKGIVFCVIIVAVFADQLLNNSQPILRTLVIYYYIAREMLSFAENCALLGVPLPKKLVDALAQLQEEKQTPTVDRIAEEVVSDDEKVQPVSREVSIESDTSQKETATAAKDEKRE